LVFLFGNEVTFNPTGIPLPHAMLDDMNPYAKFLEGRKATDLIPEAPAKLRALAQKIGAKRMEEPLAPGKWSARQILCHLADVEIAFGFRLRQALAEEHHVIQPFEQDDWAKNYSAYDAESALNTYAALRQWNWELIRKVGPSVLGKKVSHPERGEMTFQTLLETMAGHDLNHMAQLETIAGRKA
jgi:uncharacterized damage-inducible protein DinB